jgi:hypothetical protein
MQVQKDVKDLDKELHDTKKDAKEAQERLTKELKV